MYRIEKLDDTPMTKSGVFVEVYKGDEYIGACLAGPESTPYDCAQSVYANMEIDRMELREDVRINMSLDY